MNIRLIVLVIIPSYTYHKAGMLCLQQIGWVVTFMWRFVYLQKIPEGSIILLHACAHNPTGVDPTVRIFLSLLILLTDRFLVHFLKLLTTSVVMCFHYPMNSACSGNCVLSAAWTVEGAELGGEAEETVSVFRHGVSGICQRRHWPRCICCPSVSERWSLHCFGSVICKEHGTLWSVYLTSFSTFFFLGILCPL